MKAPFGFKEVRGTTVGAQTFVGTAPFSNGLAVIVDTLTIDGKEWRHVSFSRRSRMPSYDDMKTVHFAFCDLDAVAMQILPKRAEWVNVHPYCLHLWQPLGFDPVPDPHRERWFSVGGPFQEMADAAQRAGQ